MIGRDDDGIVVPGFDPLLIDGDHGDTEKAACHNAENPRGQGPDEMDP